MTDTADTSEPTEAVFRVEITVEAPLERAFKVFTEGFDSWWPRGHHIGATEMAEAVLEQHLGGRWFERGVDGSECEWGRVLAWEPPRHVAVSWHLDGEFRYEPDPGRASRVDVRFFAEGDNRTRVELEHSGLDRHGAGWPQLRSAISSQGGWPELLQRFAQAAS
ncbi:MAG TPA: SRPBCC family protein [Acidimicrobiales bacterium]|nr:SRPBCC family protein [Acidimicrobiales bacterium]